MADGEEGGGLSLGGGGFGHFLVELVLRFLELIHALSQSAGQFGKALGTEEHQHDNQ